MDREERGNMEKESEEAEGEGEVREERRGSSLSSPSNFFLLLRPFCSSLLLIFFETRTKNRV
jgi:hypothetical protein